MLYSTVVCSRDDPSEPEMYAMPDDSTGRYHGASADETAFIVTLFFFLTAVFDRGFWFLTVFFCRHHHASSRPTTRVGECFFLKNKTHFFYFFLVLRTFVGTYRTMVFFDGGPCCFSGCAAAGRVHRAVRQPTGRRRVGVLDINSE